MSNYETYTLKVNSAQFENSVKFYNNSVTDLFSNIKLYKINEFVLYDGDLYQCIEDYTSEDIGKFVTAKWQKQKIFENSTLYGSDLVYVAIPTAVQSRLEYTGSEITVQFNNYDSTKMTVTGTTKATELGTYTATFSLINSESAVWSDGSTDSKTVSWSIVAASVSLPKLSVIEYTYTGTTITPVYTYDSTRVTIGGEYTATDSGSHTATFNLKDTTHTVWSDKTIDEKSIMWIINKANSVVIPTVAQSVYDYTGSKISPVFTYDSSKVSIGGEYEATNIGNYSAIFSLTNSNYKWTDNTDGVKAVGWGIKSAAAVDLPSLSTTEYTYTGSLIAPEFIYDSTKITIGGTYQSTDVGTFLATFTLKSPTAEWVDGSKGEKSILWNINRATVTIPTLSIRSYAYTGSLIEPAFVYDSTKLSTSGSLSATTSGKYIAEFTPINNNYCWTDNSIGTKAISWEITEQMVELPTITDIEFDYDGEVKQPTITYDSTYVNVTGITSATDAGTYTITFSLKDNLNSAWIDESREDIAKVWSINASATVEIPTLATTSYEFTGDVITPEFIYDSTKVRVISDGSGTDIAGYIAMFELLSSNYKWTDNKTDSKTINWSIVPASVSIPNSIVQVKYDGDEHTNGYVPSNLVTMTGTDRGTEKGKYVAYYNLQYPDSSTWADGSVDTKQCTLLIVDEVVVILDKFNLELTQKDLKVAKSVSNALSITADDCSGRATTTTIHYTLTRTLTLLDDTTTTITETGTKTSDPFPQNPSTTESIQRTASLTMEGITATATFTQGPMTSQSYTLTLSEIGDYGFVKDTSILTLDQSVYDGPYKSLNQFADSTYAVARVDISGYSTFTIWLNSYAEASYDYSICSILDAESYPTTRNDATSYINTSGFQRDPRNGLDTDNWRKVTYDLTESSQYIYIVYRKDGSDESNDDRGYFVIERG